MCVCVCVSVRVYTGTNGSWLQRTTARHRHSLTAHKRYPGLQSLYTTHAEAQSQPCHRRRGQSKPGRPGHLLASNSQLRRTPVLRSLLVRHTHTHTQTRTHACAHAPSHTEYTRTRTPAVVLGPALSSAIVAVKCLCLCVCECVCVYVCARAQV